MNLSLAAIFHLFRAAELALRFAGLSPRQGVTLTFKSSRYQRRGSIAKIGHGPFKAPSYRVRVVPDRGGSRPSRSGRSARRAQISRGSRTRRVARDASRLRARLV